MKKASRNRKSPKKKIINIRRERPTLLGKKLENLVQNFINATRYKRGAVNSTTAIETANALTKSYPLLEKDNSGT